MLAALLADEEGIHARLLWLQREPSAAEEDDGRRIRPERSDLRTRHATRVERVEETGARQRRLDGAPARGPDRRLAAVAEAQQVDLGPVGPGDEPVRDAGEPRAAVDAESAAEAERRRVVDEEAAPAQDDKIAHREPRARALEDPQGRRARGRASGNDAAQHPAVEPQQRDLPVAPLEHDPPAADRGGLAGVRSAPDERLAPSLQAPQARAPGRGLVVEEVGGEDEQVSPAGDPARQPPGQSAAGDPVRELEPTPAAQREDANRTPERLGMPPGAR